MNFYPHHIGDYMTATVHLSWLEDCAYRRLLDVYYSREESLPDVAQACRLVRATSKDERKAVETVLHEFFTLTDGHWAHPRCDAEIVKAQQAAERARLNGGRGGRPPKAKPTDNPNKTQPVSGDNQEESKSKAPNPITNTSSIPKGIDGDAVLTKAELWNSGKSLLAEQGMAAAQCGSFVGKLVKDYGDEVVIDAVRSCVVKRPADAAQYLIATCKHLCGQRQKPDIARQTVPGRQERDPELVKREQDSKNAVPPSLETLERIARIKQGATA